VTHALRELSGCEGTSLARRIEVPAFPSASDRVVRFSSEPESTSPSGSTRIAAVARVRRRLWLRTESLVVLLCAVWLYAQYGRGWLLFTLFFVLPDLSLGVYVVSRRVGAIVYNLTHSYVVGVGLTAIGFASSGSYLLPLALTWVAHISFDRLIGLPYPMGVDAGEDGTRRRDHQGGPL
jgi:Domain of unknown function (DUF4260)